MDSEVIKQQKKKRIFLHTAGVVPTKRPVQFDSKQQHHVFTPNIQCSLQDRSLVDVSVHKINENVPIIDKG